MGEVTRPYFPRFPPRLVPCLSFSPRVLVPVPDILIPPNLRPALPTHPPALDSISHRRRQFSEFLLYDMRKIKSSYGNKLVIPRIQIRRSSSLQFPVIVTSEDGSKLSSLGSPSSTSLNMNMSGPSINNSMSQTSFYGSMSSYSCCCGLIRLRVGACLIGVASIGISIFTMCLLLSVSGTFSREMQTSLTLPLSALVLYQTASAMLLIIGVLIDTYPLLLPFLINCVLHGLVAVSGVIVLLLFSKDFRRHCPVVVIGGAAILFIYLWFGSVIGLTFVLIRDKKSRGLYMEASNDVRAGLDRAASSFL